MTTTITTRRTTSTLILTASLAATSFALAAAPDGTLGTCFIDPTAWPNCEDACSANEGEPCDASVPDNFNAGCNSTPEAFSTAAIDEWVCGTLWADGGERDADWWGFNNPIQKTYRLEVFAEVDTFVFIAQMTDGGVCPVVDVPAGAGAYSGACDTIHITSESEDYALAPGDYIMFVSPGNPGGGGVFDGFPCPDGTATNNAYQVRVGGVELPPPPCPWNLAGAGVTDCDPGYVGFEDILVIIGNWGQCPPGPVPCPWDHNENGVVDFADILQVIANRGPCPV